jgi:hypothetical protein
MSERDEQIKVFNWIHLHPQLKDLAFSIPNEGKRSLVLGRLYKRMGLRSGTPDIFIPYPTKTYHGLFIELKYGRNKATPAQAKFIERLKSYGYCAEVVWGADDAIKLITEYLQT